MTVRISTAAAPDVVHSGPDGSQHQPVRSCTASSDVPMAVLTCGMLRGGIVGVPLQGGG